jgi:hypothetical protein
MHNGFVWRDNRLKNKERNFSYLESASSLKKALVALNERMVRMPGGRQGLNKA